MSMSRGLASSTSRYSAKLSQRNSSPWCSTGPGMSSTPPHQLDQGVAVARPDRREADAAVAHHRRGDAVLGGGREVRVPHRLPVVVGVDVHEARRDESAARVDLLAAAAGHFADGGDPPVLDGDVRLEGGAPGAVDDGAAADDEVSFD